MKIKCRNFFAATSVLAIFSASSPVLANPQINRPQWLELSYYDSYSGHNSLSVSVDLNSISPMGENGVELTVLTLSNALSNGVEISQTNRLQFDCRGNFKNIGGTVYEDSLGMGTVLGPTKWQVTSGPVTRLWSNGVQIEKVVCSQKDSFGKYSSKPKILSDNKKFTLFEIELNPDKNSYRNFGFNFKDSTCRPFFEKMPWAITCGFMLRGKATSQQVIMGGNSGGPRGVTGMEMLEKGIAPRKPEVSYYNISIPPALEKYKNFEGVPLQNIEFGLFEDEVFQIKANFAGQINNTQFQDLKERLNNRFGPPLALLMRNVEWRNSDNSIAISLSAENIKISDMSYKKTITLKAVDFCRIDSEKQGIKPERCNSSLGLKRVYGSVMQFIQ